MGSSKNVISEPVDAEEGYNMMVRHSVAMTLYGRVFFQQQEHVIFHAGIH